MTIKYRSIKLSFRYHQVKDCVNSPYTLYLLGLISDYKGNQPSPTVTKDVIMESNDDIIYTCDDDHIPFITLRNPIKYTILYFTCRNSIKYLINNPKALVIHYTRVYNQVFCQNKGV